MAVRIPAAALVAVLGLVSCPKGPGPSTQPSADPQASPAPAPLAAHEPFAASGPAPGPQSPAAAAGPQGRVDFASQVQPILEAGCRPCHFPGGTMHEELPFDRPETVRLLGEKLFSRIKAPEEQALIRAFLAQEP